MDRPGLLRAMESSYGSTAADGHWSLRDAYDVLELAQVLHLAKLDLPQEPAECLAALTALTASLPTHTVRSEEQIALQQFSTPAALATLPHSPSASPPPLPSSSPPPAPELGRASCRATMCKYGEIAVADVSIKKK